MVIFPFSHWFKNATIAKKLYFVTGIMAVLVVVELGTLYFSINTLSSVRAIVGAEDLWSKAQKDAVYHLQKYHLTRNPEDEKAFYEYMQIPLSHHETLVELLKENPDWAVARRGLIMGGNHPKDIDGMIKLYQRFDNVSYIQKSLNIWVQADSVVATLIPVAKNLNSEINSESPSQAKLDALLEEIERINQKLTVLENNFSSTIGAGARAFERIILTILVAITLTVGFSGLTFIYSIIKGISTGLKEIMRASKSIAKRDFTAKAHVFSNDEIGMLARSFNEMTAELSDNSQKLMQADQDLEFKTNFIQQNEKRILNIMNALVKTTQLDFSEKLLVSDRGDEIDAIAVGLNTLSEELEYHLQQLKKSEEKLNNAQRLAKIGNWEMDMSTMNVQWSDELYNVYGYGNERFDVTFETALERMLPEDIEKAKSDMNKNIEQALLAFHEHGTLEYNNPPVVFTIQLPDGSKKVAQGMGKIVLNADGKVLKMAGTVQDITERDRAERKLHQNNIDLIRKNKEIEQFAYAASHDLQEPLRSMSNFVQLLSRKLEDYPDEDIKKYMSLISGGASRMSALIFDLLEYSRAGRDISKSSIDCNTVVEEILTDLTTIIEENDARIHVEELPVLYCHDLKSVFRNLIINGIKFRQKGTPPSIHISACENATEFQFAIKDNGIGIEKEYFNRIFIIFQRLHTRFEYEGTGIGLSLCKKIVELNGGEIWVESEFGNGSSFHFTIPKTNTSTL